jgi:pentose-5-phosphate-3-epimerase
VRQMLDAAGRGKALEVDGNLTPEWASQCVALGASILVAGTSSLFRQGADLYAAYRDFRARMNLSQTGPTL